MFTLFISDLHLHPSRPAIISCFVRFLNAQRGKADALYILGDLFEVWIGDDDPEPAYGRVRNALKECVDAGTPVMVMRGNRDFLLGEQFSADTGCRLIEDPARIDLYGMPTLLMHGDTLCTDDADYQALRKQLRNTAWQQQVLALPLSERRELAQQARELSGLNNRDKDPSIMDVNVHEVRRVINDSDVRLLIHGHTHRPGTHDYELGDRTATRIDLGDWYETASMLVVDPQGWRRQSVDCARL
ncbi:MAG: UDP-2,3-diacylglucosamine diphosphatase [Thiogranum sp.]|nr:UDP-2,3-diacylglucosamine diphosphatase [Thiogranum sp.]